MPLCDLREFIQRLEQAGELCRVKVEVDPLYEIGAICRKASRGIDADRNKGFIFEHPKGHTIPVAVNLLGTRRRCALAMDTIPAQIHRQWLKRVERPLAPILVADGPCKEVIWRGPEVDLGRFPIPTWNELDGGPYLTMPCHISKDPQTGQRNVGMYRPMVHDRQTVGILAAPYRHIAQQWMKGEPRQPFPVAIAMGLDPAIYLAAAADLPLGVDELAVAGALRGAPVELVPCETIPLEVPATAEIVLEGEVIPDTLLAEGPFGEYAGYYGNRRERPVIRIKAITHRREPILQCTYVGPPPQESNLLVAICREAEILRGVPLPGLRQIHFTDGGCGHYTAIASIEKRFEGYGKMLGLAIFGTWSARPLKTLIVVDDDIDPFDWTQVQWALATRVQPHRDVEIFTELVGSILDPSLPEGEKRSGHSRISKMLIDATRYDAETFETPCLPKQEVMDRVERQWQRYGIPLS